MESIGIIGLGLIGGSFAKAFKKYTNLKVLGYDSDDNSLKKAKLLHAIDEELTDNNINTVDYLLIALNPSITINILQEKCKFLKSGTIVFDIAGNKTKICEKMHELKKQLPFLNFISTHPMAGKEFSGISYSSAKLFENASMLIMPIDCPLNIITKAKNLFYSLNFSSVSIISPLKHDKIIAYTSQLAHIVSSAYMSSAPEENYQGFFAGSFKDLTRVAKMNPNMWAELFLENKTEVLTVINEFYTNLKNIENAIKTENKTDLLKILQKGNDKKEESLKSTRDFKKLDN